MPVPPIVPVLALTAAFLGAAATIFIRQGLRGSDAYTGFWVNVVVGALGSWIAVAVTGGPGPVTATALAFFVLAGLVGTVLLSMSGQHLGFRPRLLVYPLLSATCFGLVSILRKIGLGGAGPIIGMALNVTTAAVAFGAFMLASGQRGALICRRRPLAYFVAAGLMENAAVFLNLVALGMGTVSLVTPLYGSSPIFVLLLSFFFLRGIERLTGRIVAGTLLIVLGIYLLTALSGR